MSGASQARGDFGLDAVHEQAAADGGAGRHGRFESIDLHHRVADRGAGIEHEVREVLELLPARVLTAAGFGMFAADDGDDLHAALLEARRHLDGDEVATAGRDNERGIRGREIEVAQDAFGEAGDVFEEHRLALAVRADDEIMEAQRELDDGIEARKRTVTRPHLLHENPAVARAEEVNHAPGENRLGEPICRPLNGGLLAFDGGQKFAASVQVICARSHRRAR